MDVAIASPLPSHSMMWPIARLHDSPTQPRKTYDEAKLAELGESIRVHGVLQPVLARRVGEDAQLIAGHRRKRGAVLAGLEVVPVIFLEATDAQVMELQHVENLCREDVHPLEEAESFRELLSQHGYTMERLAAKLSKPRTYVVRRLTLNHLCDDAAAAFRAGLISEYGAFTLARLPSADVQLRALRELVSPDNVASDARCRRVAERYLLSLKDAAFDTKSEALVPEAGPCTRCPKRTGANADLFGDFGKDNLCTDGGCFAQKTEAAWTRACEQALSRGDEILDEESSRKLFSYGGRLMPGSPYVDLALPCPLVRGNHTWKQLLASACPQVTLARDDAGRGHRLVLHSEAREALVAMGHLTPAASPDATQGHASGGGAVDARARDAALREAQSRRRMTVETGLEAMVAGAERGPLSLEVLRYLVHGVLEASWQDVRRQVARRRGFIKSVDAGSPEQALLASLETMTAEQLQGVLVETVAVRFAAPNHMDVYGAAFLDGCRLFGLDVEQLEAEAAARMAAKKERPRSMRSSSTPHPQASAAPLSPEPEGDSRVLE
jgi:ParB/RepB/Spo0J family partition protein